MTDNSAAIFGSGKTVWRSLMNGRLQEVELGGKVLDVGAGEIGSADYHNFILGIRVMNAYSLSIAFEHRPTVVADAERSLPFKDGAFNAALLFNALEHIYQYQHLLSEIFRLLKFKGIIYMAIPFLNRVHQSPQDFYRLTYQTIERSLQECRFSDIVIEPLGSGALIAALAQVDFLVPKVVRKRMFKLCQALDQVISAKSNYRYRNRHDYPIGYFATATKNL